MFQFEEGLKDSKKIVTQSDVAYSHFIYEALDSLIRIFGLDNHYSSFFKHNLQARYFHG